MLRQALVDAAEAAREETADESTQLLPVVETSNSNPGDPKTSASTYGTTSATGEASKPARANESVVSSRNEEERALLCSDEEGEELADDDEDSLYQDFLDTEEDEEDQTRQPLPPSRMEQLWTRIKSLFRVVANVDNLWDSPPPPSLSDYDDEEDNNGNETTDVRNFSNENVSTSRNHRRRRRQRLSYYYYPQKYLVLFWFVVLALSYAGERSTFKVLVDRAGPFRLFSVQMLTGSHALILSLGMAMAYYTQVRQKDARQQHASNHHYHNPGVSRTASGTPVTNIAPSAMLLPLGVSLVDCVLMAVLDTVTLVLVFLTGEHVPPTLTVILVQFTIPLAAFLSQFIHPDGRWTFCKPDRTAASDDDNNCEASTGNEAMLDNRENVNSFHQNINNTSNDRRFAATTADVSSMEPRTAGMSTIPPLPPPSTREIPWPGWGGLGATHIYGSLILVAAVSLALCPAFYSIAHPDFFTYAEPIPTRTAINTLFFVSSCVPAAASQLYKEHIFLQNKQPVNMVYLNLLLSIFQFIFCSVSAPLLYGLQGLGSRGNWTKLYPASEVSENFVDGLKCFWGLLDAADQEDKYPEEADCNFALGLVLLHVFSIISVGVAVDKIVNAGATNVMYRGISAGIIVAVLSMHFYDMRLPDFAYGPAIDALNLVCLVLLVLGSEVYHRASLQESTFETIYPAVEVPTFED